MGINLSRREIGMTEHLLQRPEISAVGQKMRGERMAQHVGRYAPEVETRLNSELRQTLVEPNPCKVP